MDANEKIYIAGHRGLVGSALCRVLEGHGYRAIGERLFISPKTVEHHVARIRSRLGATSRGELLERLHDILVGREPTR